MEMEKNLTATLKYALLSDKKMAVVAKLVVGKKVKDALEVLKYMPKKGAHELIKVIKSASANATQNGSADPAKLVIQKIYVTRAPKLKRIRFVSRSRISHYVKYRCFVKVFLSVK
jgi:large subunit ribosomal protein L22